MKNVQKRKIKTFSFLFLIGGREERGTRWQDKVAPATTSNKRSQSSKKYLCGFLCVNVLSFFLFLFLSLVSFKHSLSLVQPGLPICDCLSDKIKVQSHSQSVLWLSKSEYQKVNLLFLKGCLCLFLFFLPLHAGRENFSFQEGDEDDDAD